MPTCKQCGETRPDRLYSSGKMDRCHDCQWFENHKDEVDFSLDEFKKWRDQNFRPTPGAPNGGNNRTTCCYCGIDKAQLPQAQQVNSRNKKIADQIGVDRKDASRGYTIDNLMPACLGCNQIRSSVLSVDEMMELGPHIRKIWDSR